MRKSYRWVFAAALILLVSAVGCSDDSKSGGGDGDHAGSGGLAASTGGTTQGDGDFLDPCFGALVFCDNGCADLTSDELNCGDCGERCAAGESCQDSACVDGALPGDGGNGGQGGAGGGAGAPN